MIEHTIIKIRQLLESDERIERLRRKALSTGDMRTWDAYEQALIRSGELERALKNKVGRASINDSASIRRVLDAAGDTFDLFLTLAGDERKPQNTYLIQSVSGNTIRSRRLIHSLGHVRRLGRLEDLKGSLTGFALNTAKLWVWPHLPHEFIGVDFV